LIYRMWLLAFVLFSLITFPSYLYEQPIKHTVSISAPKLIPVSKPIQDVKVTEVKTEIRKTFKVVATAYTKNDPGMDGRGITKNGTKVKPIEKPDPVTGLTTIAAHPSFLLPGTIIVIPALSNYPNKGRFIVEDTGGAIKRNKIDICFASRGKAIKFGIRTLEAYREE